MLGINLSDLIFGLSEAINLTTVGLGRDCGAMQHGFRVWYISYRTAEQMSLDAKTNADLYYAALLHDAGVSSNAEFRKLLHLDFKDNVAHCNAGHTLLKKSPYTERYANIVLHHHDNWAGPNKSGVSGEDIPICSRIIHLADRVDVLRLRGKYLQDMRDDIVHTINKQSGTIFDPQIVKAFNQAAGPLTFWLDVMYEDMRELLQHLAPPGTVEVEDDELEGVAAVFAEIIDAKSRFTLRHSKRVSAIANVLGQRSGLAPSERKMLRIAGLLHDLGKLSIPDEILEKPDKLTNDEIEIIRRHSYFTRLILNRIKGLEKLAQVVDIHHARSSEGRDSSYANEDNLLIWGRILHVSDIFTALAEDRPYRKRYPKKEICEILNKCVLEVEVDGNMVKIITDNIDEFYKLLNL